MTTTVMTAHRDSPLLSVLRSEWIKLRTARSTYLAVAAALLGDPPVLLLDEPVNGLDPAGIHWIRDLLRTLAAQGRAVFVSSHLISEMALMAKHIIIIGQGRLLADEPIADLAENTPSLEDAFLRLTRTSTEYQGREGWA